MTASTSAHFPRTALTVKELAHRWGVPEGAVRTLLALGKLRCFRLSERRIRIPLDAVTDYEEATTEGGASAASPANTRAARGVS